MTCQEIKLNYSFSIHTCLYLDHTLKTVTVLRAIDAGNNIAIDMLFPCQSVIVRSLLVSDEIGMIP